MPLLLPRHEQQVDAQRRQRRESIHQPLVGDAEGVRHDVEGEILRLGLEPLQPLDRQPGVLGQRAQAARRVGQIGRREDVARIEATPAIEDDVESVGEQPRRERYVVPAIGRQEQQPAARAQDARQLREDRLWLRQVLGHVAHDDQIEGVAEERERAQVPAQGVVDVRVIAQLVRGVDADDAPDSAREAVGEDAAAAAAGIEDHVRRLDVLVDRVQQAIVHPSELRRVEALAELPLSPAETEHAHLGHRTGAPVGVQEAVTTIALTGCWSTKSR